MKLSPLSLSLKVPHVHARVYKATIGDIPISRPRATTTRACSAPPRARARARRVPVADAKPSPPRPPPPPPPPPPSPLSLSQRYCTRAVLVVLVGGSTWRLLTQLLCGAGSARSSRASLAPFAPVTFFHSFIADTATSLVKARAEARAGARAGVARRRRAFAPVRPSAPACPRPTPPPVPSPSLPLPRPSPPPILSLVPARASPPPSNRCGKTSRGRRASSCRATGCSRARLRQDRRRGRRRAPTTASSPVVPAAAVVPLRSACASTRHGPALADVHNAVKCVGHGLPPPPPLLLLILVMIRTLLRLPTTRSAQYALAGAVALLGAPPTRSSSSRARSPALGDDAPPPSPLRAGRALRPLRGAQGCWAAGEAEAAGGC